MEYQSKWKKTFDKHWAVKEGVEPTEGCYFTGIGLEEHCHDVYRIDRFYRRDGEVLLVSIFRVNATGKRAAGNRGRTSHGQVNRRDIQVVERKAR